MPILSGVQVYRITDLPELAVVPPSAVLEVAYDNANYKTPVSGLTKLIVASVSGTVSADFNSVVVITAPSTTVTLPTITASTVGRPVHVKRLYTSGPASTVQAASGQTIDGVVTVDTFNVHGMSVTYMAISTSGWARL